MRDKAILRAARQKRADGIRALFYRREEKIGGTIANPARSPALRTIFLPLACGYLLSYVFRTINGPLAEELIEQFGLDAGSLGILTSTYFLAFSLAAIPLGVALDAFGPRRVQGWLMIVAAIGALVFAFAPGMPLLIVGRAVIGLGVSGGLMAGLKAHALWISPRYLPLANGGLVMFGGFGAIAATMPMNLIDLTLGWRGTFLVLAVFSVTVAFSIFALVPGLPRSVERLHWRDVLGGFGRTVSDWRFLRIAPLSASVVGAAFAIHGLWAARWLTDIDGLQSTEVLRGLLAMGVGLTIGALLIGFAAVWLRGVGVSESKIFSGFCITFIVLQLVLQSRAAVPPALLWGMIGGFGGMTVLSYSILDGMFEAAVVGRANSALNVLHLASAWVIQAGMGLIVAQWPPGQSGHYPIIAYRAAFALPLVMQIGGLTWFLVFPRIGRFEKTATPVNPLIPGCGVEAVSRHTSIPVVHSD